MNYDELLNMVLNWGAETGDTIGKAHLLKSILENIENGFINQDADEINRILTDNNIKILLSILNSRKL